ncbi:adenylate/guanylate cyclase domain-containing protein [Magnetospirillum sp. UT-4]|uniref:adenylate/guanylate cyclase domain-containing protein n=1 Tax=Magnetospirillum sp. UT-4 TaxID=2681467 RepID=UPI0013817A92|nr:adenylate/guanylate cyclase domain-containing protein [Magnetospirillum sp. UT-4]CAA7614216.1 Adenylate cyclase [Magnetospirillum sp. UT-4]
MGGLSKRYDVMLAVVMFLLAIPAQHLEWFALLEDQTLSFRHQLRLAYGDPKDLAFSSNDIVLVNTDEAFFRAYKSFPFRRTDIGAIVRNVHALGAKVVAVDILMDFPSSYGEDPKLAQDLKGAGNTLLVAQAQFDHGRFVKVNRPTEELHAASRSAYTNISSNSALLTMLSRLRVYPEIAREQDGWPFAVQAAAMYLGVEPELDGTVLKLGDISVPLDHAHRLYIDYPPLPTGSRFLSQTAGISALDFLDIEGMDENEREELSYWVRDKIVIIGDTSEVSHDWFDTPVGMVYGVEIIADSIHSLLKGGPLKPPPPPVQAAVIVGVMLLMLAVAFLSSPLLRALAALAVLLGYTAIASAAYVKAGAVLPLSYVLLAAFLSYLLVEYRAYMIERDQKQQIAKTFGQYIPTELVEEMNKTGQQVSVGGESREMTVLFSDVRGFTTISEGLNPQELTTLMNAFLSPMTHIIHDYRGTIDKYMGDAIMAFWGAPLKDEDHARHAVQAALRMNVGMAELSESFVARGWKPLKIGIGLNTGVMNVGNMGSDFRLAYTVLGDAVNLGSRIESLTKQYGVSVMISEYTKAKLPDLIAREMDRVRVKGKDQPVQILEPVGFEGEVDADTIRRIERHHEALVLYAQQKWDEARAILLALQAEEPDRKIYAVYLDRIAHFIEEPPGADWDGVYTHKEK